MDFPFRNLSGSRLNPNSKPFDPSSRFTISTSSSSSSGSNSLNTDLHEGFQVEPRQVPRCGGVSAPGILPTDLSDNFGLRGLVASLTKHRGATSHESPNALGFNEHLIQGMKMEGALYDRLESPMTDSAWPWRTGVPPMKENVPFVEEYMNMWTLGAQLPLVTSKEPSSETLFYMFYCMPGDMMQMLSACKLHSKGWRYHKVKQIWIARIPKEPPEVRTVTFEKGTYAFFDVGTFRISKGMFTLFYADIAECPELPPDANHIYEAYHKEISKKADDRQDELKRQEKRMRMKANLMYAMGAIP